MELNGLNTAITAYQEKFKKRETQFNNALEQVKKQKEEMKNIVKSIDSKLTKKLNSTLEKKPHGMIREMVTALVGVLENTENPSGGSVSVSFRNV